MKKSVICLLLILSVGLWETEMFAQRMSINCSNSTGANLDVTVVLKSPEGKSTSFSGNKLESKSFDCELTERGGIFIDGNIQGKWQSEARHPFRHLQIHSDRRGILPQSGRLLLSCGYGNPLRIFEYVRSVLIQLRSRVQ